MPICFTLKVDGDVPSEIPISTLEGLSFGKSYILSYDERLPDIENDDYAVQEHLGLESLTDCFNKVKKGRVASMKCPHISCSRQFIETGNLKTHLRIHVSISFPR